MRVPYLSPLERPSASKDAALNDSSSGAAHRGERRYAQMSFERGRNPRASSVPGHPARCRCNPTPAAPGLAGDPTLRTLATERARPCALYACSFSSDTRRIRVHGASACRAPRGRRSGGLARHMRDVDRAVGITLQVGSTAYTSRRTSVNAINGLNRRSSFAWAKYALALRRVSLAAVPHSAAA